MPYPMLTDTKNHDESHVGPHDTLSQDPGILSNVTESDSDMEFRAGLMVNLALFLLAARFLYELRHCFRECWTCTKEKVEGEINDRRLLKMTLDSDNLSDMLVSECSVCLEDFSIGDKVIVLPCYHNFHETCIREWISNHGNCPLCRANIS